jgi:hypothetical protein
MGRVLLIVGAVLGLVMFCGGGLADAAVSPKPPTPIAGAAKGVSAPDIASNVVASADWGVANGVPWYHVTKGQLVAPPVFAADPTVVASADRGSRSAAASAACHEEISNVSYLQSPTRFAWRTEQICTGSFSPQWLKTQLWRSSWSGPRGYSGWGITSDTSSTQLGPISWGINCNSGKGYYDYYAVVQGHASFGYGPQVRSDNTLTSRNCGPTAP